MTSTLERRQALKVVGLGLAALGGSVVVSRGEAATASDAPLLAEGAGTLKLLMERLAKAPRRRNFKTVPMILNDKSQWDDEALREIMAYKAGPKQVWDVTDIEGAWLNGMRNALNAQIWSFRHPDFLIVAECHGSAHLALYD